MKQIPLARVGLVTPIIKFLRKIGTPIELHLNSAKIPLLALEDPETLVPLPMLLEFIGKTAKAEGIENLGIGVGKAARITETGMFGQLISQSLNVYDVVRRVCQLSSHAMSKNGEQFWLEEAEENIWFCQKFVSPLHLSLGFDHSVYYSLALMLDCLRLALGYTWQPPDIYLTTSPYREFAEKLNVGNTRLHYQKPFNAICVPRRLLSSPVHHSRRTKVTPHQLSLQEWESTAPALDFVESLEQTLKTLLLEKYPTIDIVAEASGLSIRTLQRYLSRHNLTYSQLMDQVRYELALPLLNNPDVQLIEIAYTLGFSDPANFSHAFRRWTGMSPRKFRQNLSGCTMG